MSIVHGVSGLRMPPEAEALSRGSGGLLMDAPWRDALGNAGRERAFRDHSCQAVAESMAIAQAAALEIAGRQSLPIDPGLILASGGLSDLGPQEAATAWSRAIAEHLARVGDGRSAHLAAIAEAINALPVSKPHPSAA